MFVLLAIPLVFALCGSKSKYLSGRFMCQLSPSEIAGFQIIEIQTNWGRNLIVKLGTKMVSPECSDWRNYSEGDGGSYEE